MYTAADNVSLKLPPVIINMLMGNRFDPDSRSEFTQMLNGVEAGSQIKIKNLGQRPKHFAEGDQGTQFIITELMIDVWRKLDSNDCIHSIKRILSGPFGVGKSYLAWFLAAMAYASGWLTLYIADVSILKTCNKF